jgi:hypothetical protein
MHRNPGSRQQARQNGTPAYRVGRNRHVPQVIDANNDLVGRQQTREQSRMVKQDISNWLPRLGGSMSDIQGTA